jgi:hypothetical protein
MTLINGYDGDPWEQFETLGEIVGFVHKQHGVAGIIEVLKRDTKSEFTREDLQDAASELKAAGLTKAAAVVTEAAASAPSMFDLRYCPYPANDEYNVQAWLRLLQRMRPQ